MKVKFKGFERYAAKYFLHGNLSNNIAVYIMLTRKVILSKICKCPLLIEGADRSGDFLHTSTVSDQKKFPAAIVQIEIERNLNSCLL